MFDMICEKTKYTMAADPPPGYLCHLCAKASGIDPHKKPAPRKRKSAVEKRDITHYYKERQFPTLVSLCIKVSVIVPLLHLFTTCSCFILDHIQTYQRH
jgi:hypothetical protein